MNIQRELKKARATAEALGMTVKDVLLRKAFLYHQAATMHDVKAEYCYRVASHYRELAEKEGV